MNRKTNKNKPARRQNQSNQQQPQNQNQISAVHQSVMYSGPIPPADELKRLEEIQPGAAERIITMAEKSQEHTHQMELGALKAKKWEVRIGQILGFIVTIVAFGFCAYLATIGHATLGGIIGGTTITAIATAFIYGRKQN